MNIFGYFAQFNIQIKDKSIYQEALTHNSFANENHLKYTYQRLEFLGDALIQTQVSLFLYYQNKKIKEGLLTKYRAKIVRENTLASVAQRIGISPFIRLGNGEIKSNGSAKLSILADVYEAVTAAIYLDQGQEGLNEWLDKTLFAFISSDQCFFDEVIDPKSELQELLQSENRSDLKYVVENEKHLDKTNQIEYTISVVLDEVRFGTGVGFSKQEAEQNAARDCLKKMSKTTKR